jgi:hypothetical protein
MTKIRITTDRLPQPDRRRGAMLDVTPEKAASLQARGFAEIMIEDDVVNTPSPRRSRKLEMPN